MRMRVKVLTAVMFLFGAVLMAQSHDIREIARKRTDRMVKELHLTPGQEKQVYAIHLKYAERFVTLRHKEPSKARRLEGKNLRSDVRKDLQLVLNDAQMRQFEKKFRKRQEKHEQFEQMRTALNLTPKQEKRMAQLRKRQYKEMKAIRQMKASEAVKRQKRKELREEMKAAYASVLNPDQMRKFQHMRKRNKKHRKDQCEKACKKS